MQSDTILVKRILKIVEGLEKDVAALNQKTDRLEETLKPKSNG